MGVGHAAEIEQRHQIFHHGIPRRRDRARVSDDRDTLAHDALSSTASFYLVVAPNEKKKVKPFGEWNFSRVLVRGNHVEHWLNGEQVLEYELGSKAVLDQVAKTKFKGVADFGTKIRGHILLTYHNDECSFRNIKLRVPKAAN